MMRNTLALGFALVAATLASACSDGFNLGLGGSSSGGKNDGNGANGADETPSDVFVKQPEDLRKEARPDFFTGLKSGPEQTAAVCARGQNNRVTNALCSGASITSIKELQKALGLDFKDPNGKNAFNGNPGFALLGNSSSLVARNVSAVNPRAIIFTPVPGLPQRLPGYTAMGFTRGEEFVEIASEDPKTKQLTFYLLRFEKDCNKDGCTNGDLFTPEVESGWTGFTLYDDSDLKNTMLDCLSCHQPTTKAPKALLMREMRDPWTHWFRNDRPGGIALLVDYLRVHDGEDYAGIPANMIEKSDGRALEDLIQGQGLVQSDSVLFDGKQIEAEVKSVARGQPDINVPVGSSSTWQALYQKTLAGQELPPPYHDVKVTDPDKLLFVSTRYVQLRNGQIKKSELPDMTRVFLDSALPDLSMVPKVGATGKEVLLQMCAQCHQPDLDQSISRARFDMSKLLNGTMSKEEKEAAKARLTLPSSDARKMPPLIMRQLPPESLQAAIDELSK